MMKRFILFLFALAMTAGAAFAIPAKRGFKTHLQSDGTSITVQCIGDEFNHSFATTDGLTLAMDERGDFYYRTVTGISNVKAHNVESRDANELAFVEQQKHNLKLAAIASEQVRSKIRRNAAAQKAAQVPAKGSPKIPILLVQYPDKKMSNAKSAFVNQFSTGSTSVKQYFIDQSNGQYSPQFEVFGIYTLPSNRATYGGHSNSGNDKGVALMVADACKLAQAEGVINWKNYDNDGDGQCDVVIVMYAGVGEAQAQYVPDAVWPCQWDLYSGHYFGDGPGPLTYNSTRINKFAVFNEVNGSNDKGTTLDGIGTFCHEFSHCLGLPDFYETTYDNDYYGMGSWSLMDYGSYNNNGYTPIGYSAYEKNFMGWLDYVAPKANTKYTLPVFNQKNANTDVAVKVTSPINANECYILEYRKRQGWDQYIAADGVLISHCSYIKSRWDANTVNNESVQLMTIIPADKTFSTATESTDLYGSGNHELTNSSSPAAILSLTASGSPSSNAGYMNQPLTEINLNSDGTASFWYMKENSVQLSSVQLSGALTKTEYKVGESFSPDGLVLTALYTDGSQTEVTDKATWEYEPEVLNEAGTVNVIVYASYMGKSDIAEYTVTVKNTAEYTFSEEHFSGCNSQGGRDGNFSQGSGSLADKNFDNSGWVTEQAAYAAYSCIRIGSSSSNGSIKSPCVASTEFTTISFDFAGWNSGTNTLSVTINGGGTFADGSTSKNFTATNSTWKTVSESISGLTTASSFTFSGKRVFLDDVVLSANSPVTPPSAPVFNPAPGVVKAGTVVTITAPEGCSLEYKINGGTPLLSTGNTANVAINENTTIKAVSKMNGVKSEIAEASYTVQAPFALTISPASGTYNSPQTVTISTVNAVGDVIICYTTDGSDPASSTSAIDYEAPFVVSSTTTVKAYAVDSDSPSNEASAEAVFTITSPQPASSDFVLVTSADHLKAGDEVIIVSSKTDGDAYAISTTQATNNRPATTVTVANGRVSATDVTQVLTLEGGADGWFFNTGNGYLYAAGTVSDKKTNNYLRTGELTSSAVGNNAKALISIADDNAASIVFQGTNKCNIMQFNPNNGGSPLFSCYSKEMQPVYIYKRSSSAPEVLSLADLAKNGVAGAPYDVTDAGLVAVTKFQAADKYFIVAHDAAQAVYNVALPNENDLTFNIEGRQDEYAQNNWMIIQTSAQQYDKVVANGQKITSVKGILSDAFNTTIEASDITTGEVVADATAFNTYCVVNFMGASSVNSPSSGNNYFFMMPKRCELAKVTWAVFKNGYFYVPQQNGNVNSLGFSGAVRIAWDYNMAGDLSDILAEKSASDAVGSFSFNAVVKEIDPSSALAMKAAAMPSEVSAKYVVFPVDITADISTAITDVTTGKQVKNVRFFNTMGVESRIPGRGVNIVVTTFSDGSVSSTKMIR